MIKAVIFDYGGVVTAGGIGHGASIRLAENMSIELDFSTELTKNAWRGLLTGKYTPDDFWQEVEKNYGKPIPETHKEIWNTWEHMQPRPGMIKFIEQLKKDYVVGLLSNVIPSTSKEIRDHGGYDLFEPCILSYEVGCAKPDVEIYQLLLSKLPGIKPEEVIFIDDQERCLIPARKMGIKTVLAQTEEQIIGDVSLLL